MSRAAGSLGSLLSGVQKERIAKKLPRIRVPVSSCEFSDPATAASGENDVTRAIKE